VPGLPSRPRSRIDPGYRVLSVAADVMVVIGAVGAILWFVAPSVVPGSIGFGSVALIVLGAVAIRWLGRIPDVPE